MMILEEQLLLRVNSRAQRNQFCLAGRKRNQHSISLKSLEDLPEIIRSVLWFEKCRFDSIKKDVTRCADDTRRRKILAS